MIGLAAPPAILLYLAALLSYPSVIFACYLKPVKHQRGPRHAACEILPVRNVPGIARLALTADFQSLVESGVDVSTAVRYIDERVGDGKYGEELIRR